MTARADATSQLAAVEISKSFGGVLAVDAVSLEARAGEVVGLVGPNGAGKTTLINMLTGFDRPSSGHIELDGRPINGRRAHDRVLRGMARTFQHAHSFPSMTVGESMRAAGHVVGRAHRFFGVKGLFPDSSATSAVKHRASQLLADFRLEEWADANSDALPYGIKKRLAVAMALMADPTFLLLDEPAAGLNTSETAALAGDVMRLKQAGVGLILVEHNVPLIMQVSDRVVVLHHGRKIADGAPADVASDREVISAYLGESRVAAS